jgi:putative transposase
VNGQAYRDRADAEASIETFIETVYNRQRLHSALAYLAPEDIEAKQPPLPGLPASATGGGTLSPVPVESLRL